jgi:hypothetical protein
MEKLDEIDFEKIIISVFKRKIIRDNFKPDEIREDLKLFLESRISKFNNSSNKEFAEKHKQSYFTTIGISFVFGLIDKKNEMKKETDGL